MGDFTDYWTVVQQEDEEPDNKPSLVHQIPPENRQFAILELPGKKALA
jgi:hypothetical protein